MGKRPPHTFGQTASPYQFPHSPPTLSFVWLLSILVEWWLPKIGNPPISPSYDGCHFGAPNKEISCSKQQLSACSRLIGSCGTLIWVHDGCCHGQERHCHWGGRMAIIVVVMKSGDLDALCFHIHTIADPGFRSPILSVVTLDFFLTMLECGRGQKTGAHNQNRKKSIFQTWKSCLQTS